MFSEELAILFHVIPVSVANGRQKCSVSACLMNTCLCVHLFSGQPGRSLGQTSHGDSDATDGDSEEEGGEDVDNDEVSIG